jgi:hypothetical protein
METDLELKPTAGGRVALTLLGVVFLALAIFVVVAAMKSAHADHGAPVTAGLVMGAIAIALLGFAVRLGRRRVIVDREGVEVRGVLGDRRIAWSAVTSYSFVSIDTTNQAYYAQGGLVAVLIVAAVKAMRKKPQHRKFRGGRLVIHASDGTKAKIAPWFRDIDQGLERIFAELHPRLEATTGTDFGKLAFDGHTLSHPSKGALSLPEIEKISVSPNGVVSIRKVGKRLAWASVRMSAITSSLLLFERLAQRGVIVNMSDTVFLPLPTLGLLSRLTAARESLPQARIQRR